MLPAVLSMQYPIPDESAIEFSRTFYTSFVKHFQVDRAVAEARRNLLISLESGRIDWGIPILFMRESDGIIFEIK